ncbi:MAG: site-2 protease family protein [Actinomycetia bacterium]|nr:site-2 protease family protein [Actinomycetes bacterium]
MGNIDLLGTLLSFALLIPAIVFHEVAHGYAALALGDTTAKDSGRLSFNPIAHIDLWGTILLPLLMIAMFGAGFGYAKPVPVNPYRFRGDRRMGMFLTGLAGPGANLVMAAAGAVVVRLAGMTGLVGTLGYLFALVNLVLLFFNLIPLPPLDGSRILPLFLSERAMAAYEQWERYGFVILIAVLWIVPAVFKFDPFTAYFQATVYPVLRLLTGA